MAFRNPSTCIQSGFKLSERSNKSTTVTLVPGWVCREATTQWEEKGRDRQTDTLGNTVRSAMFRPRWVNSILKTTLTEGQARHEGSVVTVSYADRESGAALSCYSVPCCLKPWPRVVDKILCSELEDPQLKTCLCHEHTRWPLGKLRTL